MTVRIDTLPGLRVVSPSGEAVALASRRLPLALLVYLAVERTSTRDTLLALLWPERDDERARHSLSQAVHELRRNLGDDCIAGAGDTARAGDDVETDLARFEAAVAGAHWAEALELYGGGFLEGSHLASTHAFEEWVDGRRAQAARLHRRARRELVAERLAAGDVAGALVVAQRWAELEPLDDEAQQRAIELLARLGRRTEALQHYEHFRERLRGEDLEPMPELEQLAADIGAGRLQPQVATLPAAAASVAGDVMDAAPSSPAAPDDVAALAAASASPGDALPAPRATRDLLTGGIAGLLVGAPCALLAAVLVRAFLPPVSPVALGALTLVLAVALALALVAAAVLVWRRPRGARAGMSAAALRPARPSRRVGAGLGFALGFLVALTAAFALAPGGAPGTMAARLAMKGERRERGRVAVTRFANRSGDAALEPIGRMAEEWVAQKLRSIPEAELVAAAPATPADSSAEAVARLASTTRADAVLFGSYYREGSDVLFVARLVPAPGAGLPEEVAAMPIGPVRVSAGRPTPGVERLAAVVAGAVASACIGPECAPGRHPPTYEARLAWLEAQSALFERGDQEDAIRQFRRAIALDSTFVNAYTGLASQYMFQGRCIPVDSIGEILESRREDFAEYDLFYMRSMRASCHSDFEGAYHNRAQALRIAPDAWGARWGVAEAAVMSGRLHEAEQRMRGMSNTPAANQANYYNLFTYALHVQGRFADELQVAEQGRQRVPAAAGRYQVGMRALAALGRGGDIEGRLAEARLSPQRELDLPDVYLQLAAELEWHGHRELARQYALRALDELDRFAPAERASPGYRVQRALTLLQLERWAEARRLLDGTTVTEAWRRESGEALNQAQVLALRGIAAARSGDAAAARAILLAIDRLPADEFATTLMGVREVCEAEVLAALGDKGEALRRLGYGQARGTVPRSEPFLTHSVLTLRDLWHDPEFERMFAARD